MIRTAEKCFNKRWFMLDFARQRTFNREEILDLLDVLNKCGYNGLAFYLEGYYEFSCLDGCSREGCLSVKDTEWLKSETKKRGLDLIPFTNLVGHANSFLTQERFADMGTNIYQFDFLRPEVSEFTKKILDELIMRFEPKFIHIGGDEVALNENQKQIYASYLSNLCEYLMEKGIEPGIWGDMIVHDPSIAEQMNKDITVFDWWYYGHRPETIEILKKAGFNNIVVCPGTQTWNGIVATQIPCPWRKELPWKYDRPQEYNEVEVFWQDGEDRGVYDGLLTDWENFCGHTLWSGITTIARGGLFLSAKPINDENIELALFNRVTPCSEIINVLAKAQRLFYEAVDKSLPGRFVTHQRAVDAVFTKRAMCKMLLCSYLINEDVEKALIFSAQQATELLKKWQPNGSLENRCHKTLVFACEYVSVLSKILNVARKAKSTYHDAALLQYKDNDSCLSLLNRVINYFNDLGEMYPSLKEKLTLAINDSGHNKNDIQLLILNQENIHRLIESLKLIYNSIEEKSNNETPGLPCWHLLITDIFGGMNINE